MKQRYDIRLSNAFINANNDVEWFASDMQHVEDIIQSSPGSYKENPSMGVAINNFLNSSGAEVEVKRKVMIELQGDLYQCNNPLVSYDQEGTLTINPNLE